MTQQVNADRGWLRYEKMPVGKFFQTLGDATLEPEELLSEALHLTARKLAAVSHTYAEIKPSPKGDRVYVYLTHGAFSATIKLYPQAESICCEFDAPSHADKTAVSGAQTFGDLVDSIYYDVMLDWFRATGAPRSAASGESVAARKSAVAAKPPEEIMIERFLNAQQEFTAAVGQFETVVDETLMYLLHNADDYDYERFQPFLNALWDRNPLPVSLDELRSDLQQWCESAAENYEQIKSEVDPQAE